jgi:hypothetical protein
MGSDREDTVRDRGPDAVEDRVDEIGEVPRDGVAGSIRMWGFIISRGSVGRRWRWI